MFTSPGGFAGFAAGTALTVGLLLSRHLLPFGLGYRLGLHWPWYTIVLVLGVAAAILAATLWLAGRLIEGAHNWKEGRVIGGAVLIAAVANTLFTLLVELFALRAGLRALVAMLGVPVIYGNLTAVLGKTSLFKAMAGILAGALSTMGAGFIIAAIVRGW